MKKLIKKSILNGLIRTFVSLFYTVIVRFKSFNSDLNKQNDPIAKVNKTKKVKRSCNFQTEPLVNLNKILDENDYYQIGYEYGYKKYKKSFDSVNSETGSECSQFYYEYVNEAGQVFTLSPSLIKQQNSVEINSSVTTKKYFRLRAIFVCIFVIIAYVGLNNYLIMFIYYQSSPHPLSANQAELSKQSSSESSLFLPLASFFKNKNRKLNQNLDYSYHNNNEKRKRSKL